ncbi:hypothetical protein [Serratia marcescens]|uniref:hypothetical protein n=1 Tax=Serratia TaxID=613 RepID=UPI0018D691F9|nr:hypothetical protein [Serratia marcescens]MBN5286597.1 hypothetical protein [Serratia marcescens]HEJ6993657.1 hypothetical protein [Serratia marcescens]
MDFSPFLEKCRELLNEWKSSLLIGLASAIFIIILPRSPQSEWVTLAFIIAYAMASLSIASFIVKIINIIHIKRTQNKEDSAKKEKLALFKSKQIDTAKLILNEMSSSQKRILRKLLSGPSMFDSYSHTRTSMREDLRFLLARSFIILIDELSSSKAIFQLNELFTDIVLSDRQKEIAFYTDELLLKYKDEIPTILNNFISTNPKIKLPKSIIADRFNYEPALNFYWDKFELTIRFTPHYKEMFESRLNIELSEFAIYELIEAE